jgi:hypothetical protein
VAAKHKGLQEAFRLFQRLVCFQNRSPKRRAESALQCLPHTGGWACAAVLQGTWDCGPLSHYPANAARFNAAGNEDVYSVAACFGRKTRFPIFERHVVDTMLHMSGRWCVRVRQAKRNFLTALIGNYFQESLRTAPDQWSSALRAVISVKLLCRSAGTSSFAASMSTLGLPPKSS